jgi:hypothetical protein
MLVQRQTLHSAKAHTCLCKGTHVSARPDITLCKGTHVSAKPDITFCKGTHDSAKPDITFCKGTHVSAKPDITFCKGTSVVHLTLDGVNGKWRWRRNYVKLTVKIVLWSLLTVPFLNDAVCAQHWKAHTCVCTVATRVQNKKEGGH